MEKLPIYPNHPGTIKISGSTIPKRAAVYALSCLDKGLGPIDFLCIGGNSAQQALKSMGIFMDIVEHRTFGHTTLAFQPLHYRTETKDLATNTMQWKDCSAWRTVILDKHSVDSAQIKIDYDSSGTGIKEASMG